MNDPRGSLWRKWDLHVHTPESIIHKYSGNDPWERFLGELETLPDEFKVIGINDYIFLDGYKRILKERQNGRLKNIELFLPVIELRLDKFGGSAGHLNRVNYHVIFSDELPPNLIEHQFLYALSSKYVLSPQYEHIKKKGWGGIPSRDSLSDLGTLIINSVPQNEQTKFKEPLIEGFNNLCISCEAVREVLKSPYFQDKVITAVGKTEWADIKWNDHSIAEKKTIINDADFVFISAASPADWVKAHKRLSESGVNNRLLDCSDAHNFSDASDKDRIGKCFTWIKADPTFKGLLQVLNEPEERVFIGDIPPIHCKVENSTTKYIRSIHINKRTDSNIKETWFNNEIQFNNNLVAIIGNKGKGKSALTDIIGLLCNTRQHEDFTFLSNKNFKSKDNKAKHFQATLTWESGTTVNKSLDDSYETTQPELAKYIPQNFLEKICTQFGNIEESDFDRELKKVIFSHVDDSKRLGYDNFEDLVKYCTSESIKKIELLKLDIHQINENIVKLEDRNRQESRLKIVNLLSQKNAELEAHEKSKPTEVKKPENDPDKQKQLSEAAKEINNATTHLAKLEADIALSTKDQKEQAALISIATRLIDRLDILEQQVNTFKNQSEDELSRIGLSIDTITKVTINKAPLQEKRKKFSEAKLMADRELDFSINGSLANQKHLLEKNIEQLRAKLDESNRKYQKYLEDLKSWGKKRDAIIGNKSTPETQAYYRNALEYLDKVPEMLENKKSERLKKAIEIHTVIQQLVRTYRELYAPVNEFVESNSLARERFNLKFDASIVDTGFKDKFFEYISHGVNGTFCGVEEGLKMMESLLRRQDFNTEQGIETFLNETMDYLNNDRRLEGKPVRVVDQLRKEKKVQDLYDVIFSLDYLQPRYALKMGDKELQQLSPGERGMLLLVFYLLIDKEEIPLIIDQPEENLDNQTIFKHLVPCIMEAKKRRQVIIVTHNPNLAVVCDAEQIIWADLDKKANYKMQYTSGAIENPSINTAIVDILEGTMPAFDNRESKYHKSA